MKYLFFYLFISQLSVKAQDIEKSFFKSLENAGFPVSLMDNYTCDSIVYERFEKSVIEEYPTCVFPFLIDSLSNKFYFVKTEISIGLLKFHSIFYLVSDKDSIQSIFTKSTNYSFFYQIKHLNLWENSCSDEGIVSELFNSTELTILNTNQESFGGFCYDSIMDSKLYYVFDIAVQKWGNILSREEGRLIEINQDLDYIKSCKPLFYISTGYDFLYTYGANEQKGSPEIIRFREVYFDLNRNKIIKDQLSSEFIYYDVDKW